MYNDLAGAMYEQEEKKKSDMFHRRKVLRRRICAVIFLLILLSYFVILLIDTGRYKNGLKPLITIKEETKEYDDGTVKTYYSLGWIFREYNRETIKDSEMVPFWKEIRMDDVLNRVNDGNLPAIETDYIIPDNSQMYEKVSGVLFFYNGEELLDTYKCLWSEYDCEITSSTIYPEDTDQLDPVKMGVIDNRYVFIREYRSRYTEVEESTIYLYDIKAKKLIAEYEDIRYSTIGDDNKGYIDSSKYIIKKNGKWGIDQVVKGKVTNYVDYLYDEINYDPSSKRYIFHDSNGYLVYDAFSNTKTSYIPEAISNIYVVNDEVYMMTKVPNEEEFNTYFYKVYNSAGTNIFSDDTILYLEIFSNFMVYIKNKEVCIVDFNGQKLNKEAIPIYFEMSNYGVKPLYISLNGNELKISTPKESTRTHYTDEYYYNIEDFSLTRKRVNVKETLE